MYFEHWRDSMLEFLKERLRDPSLQALLPTFRQEDGSFPGAVGVMLEWTHGWSLDDGDGAVRFTLIVTNRTWRKPQLVRVVVAAAAWSWGHEVALPRYAPMAGLNAPGDPPAKPVHVDERLTRNMATYFLEHVGGDANSLRVEPSGEVSFTVEIAATEE
ncbi:hypothetical protein QCN29_19500 [Streptomyces sp. HNM0663]|uniref:Uncharacterized protein n=1 Tax=Streptomyces chengmaiensis TaxID=3040919 RepID=A0ABT6HQF8_9ACTN|nr:hypothetical protein [Streptomyces chengmaiensis]MDH2390936.1 hypothetical protein [Streptomyces chengmaiensis]